MAKLAECVDQIDLEELKLRDTVPHQLCKSLTSIESFRWFTTASDEINRIIDESMKELTENILKYKDYDYIFSIHENDTKTKLSEWEKEEVEDDDDGPKGKKKELTAAEIKDKFKKSYRAQHCINPSQQYLYDEINK